MKRQYQSVPLRANRFVLTTTSDTQRSRKCSHVQAANVSRVSIPERETAPVRSRPPVLRRNTVILVLVGMLIIFGCLIVWDQAVQIEGSNVTITLYNIGTICSRSYPGTQNQF